MHEKHEKTNAMRQLDRKKAVYTVYSYDGGALSGTEVAAALGQDPAHCFKTLVTVGTPRSGANWTRPPPRKARDRPCMASRVGR